jgi:hypothetical protein
MDDARGRATDAAARRAPPRDGRAVAGQKMRTTMGESP